MAVPTFVDLQGFIVGKNFIVKEVAKDYSKHEHFISYAHELIKHFITKIIFINNTRETQDCDPDNFTPANPLVTPTHIQPE
ncbi:hypothetical protein ALC57_09339 [Trachymyrmex cornetzi]|uniref:Cytochrome b/b6 C-terminal region profile domain-containing protein n=1 Tax=Trachymyrmex cornetzi TaxID=471704 RepID=A0A151J5M6_9HYME|nr:hypothetical protein ALC57_09339 [Trachymyrmex cornetzi]